MDIVSGNDSQGNILCMWFFNCMNEAEFCVPHVILGYVTCCERCADLVDIPEEDRLHFELLGGIDEE